MCAITSLFSGDYSHLTANCEASGERREFKFSRRAFGVRACAVHQRPPPGKAAVFPVQFRGSRRAGAGAEKGGSSGFNGENLTAKNAEAAEHIGKLGALCVLGGSISAKVGRAKKAKRLSEKHRKTG